MRMPNVFSPTEIQNHNVTKGFPDGQKWVPARPLGYFGLCPIRRIKLAWSVFTGKNDVLKWKSHEDK